MPFCDFAHYLSSTIAAVRALASWRARLTGTEARAVLLLTAVARTATYPRLREAHALIDVSLLQRFMVVSIVAAADAGAALRVASDAHLEALAVRLCAPIARATAPDELYGSLIAALFL